MSSSELVLTGSYDYRLVALSIVIAVVSSYAALDVAGRVAAVRGGRRIFWLIGGTATLGMGIWSMHLVGMMAFRLPVSVGYHWPTALASLLTASLASFVALLVVSRARIALRGVVIGGLFIGGGIAGLHYIAMESMRLPAECHYSPPLVALSVLFAIAFSLLALRFAFLFRDDATGQLSRKFASALLMGSAISVMHYTGMAAASFTPSAVVPDLSRTVSISVLGVAACGIISVLILVITVMTTMIDRLRRAEEALQRSLDQLRALSARLQQAREEERTRVAREIHDELGQALTAIKIELASLIRDLPSETQHRNRTASTLKLVDETIQSVRRIATDLRPGILDDQGLVAAVEWAAEEFQARTGLKVSVSVSEDDIAMDPDKATALFRIFQETLTNIARHANASQVNVRLRRDNGHLSLQLRDNGKGMDEALVSATRSLGILGMRERALILGGELTIESTPGGGTTVTVRIPDEARVTVGGSQ